MILDHALRELANPVVLPLLLRKLARLELEHVADCGSVHEVRGRDLGAGLSCGRSGRGLRSLRQSNGWHECRRCKEDHHMKLHFSSPRWTTCFRALGKKRVTMPDTGQRRISQPALT